MIDYGGCASARPPFFVCFMMQRYDTNLATFISFSHKVKKIFLRVCGWSAYRPVCGGTATFGPDISCRAIRNTSLRDNLGALAGDDA
jgi:hypothetical protein